MKQEDLAQRVGTLRSLPRETEWVEFKESRADPQEIGEYLSALSNAAALCRESEGYILWGIRDATRDLVGTRFEPHETKVGNEELENWLATQLNPRIDVRIHEGSVDGARIVLLCVQAAFHTPVAFRGVEYIRVGSYKKKLKDHPEKERSLWLRFSEQPFESSVAAARVTSEDVLQLLDYPSYFRLVNTPLPDNRSGILERLEAEKIVAPQGNDRFDISNVGAILFAASPFL